ncbi:MAG: MerR family transcriptional regulator [Bdellovibrionales bacterium]|nr:MerR family transcriptional regulator [Bdellovibrionales bacterium]MBT3526707.1 MerR family transcriptional regulator [Bdellovibrionales bacterium]MBT7670655.1 MerR family transcriptional regulator [Bdellovibrionales bacterium]MBT7767906.1 MerR family transcriptional regulator [Bdellovibrionales bacterium]
MELIIPNKSSFKINEACEVVGVKPYVLRFWESEFDQIRPLVSSSGQKVYQHHDLEVIATIKELLFNQHLTIEQCKQQLSSVLSGEALDTPMVEATISLTEREVQKLVVAKAKVNSLLMTLDSIKSNHHWS